MAKTGELVFYAGAGVCLVAGSTEMETAGVKREYTVLHQCFKPESTVYVPKDNETLHSRMVSLLTKKEIAAAIAAARSTEPEWQRDYRRRNDAFRRTLQSTDRTELLLLIKSIYRHRQELADGGKALHTSDDYFLRDAEALVFSEFSEVLKEPLEEVAERVRREIL